RARQLPAAAERRTWLDPQRDARFRAVPVGRPGCIRGSRAGQRRRGMGGRIGKSGQIHYYEHKTAEHAGLHHVTETIGSISLWGGIAISVFLAVFVFRLSDAQKTVLVTMMAALSIIAAVREAYAYRKADKELIKQYRFMQRIFASARVALDRTHDPEEQREILLSLGDAALTEHAEWTLMQRERQVEHGKL